MWRNRGASSAGGGGAPLNNNNINNMTQNRRRRTRSSGEVDHNRFQMASNGDSHHHSHHTHGTGSNVHAINMLRKLNAFRLSLDHNLCDVNIIVDGEQFPAHRVVLAASSSYFEAMFKDSLAEKDQDAIEIKEIKANTFKYILGYIYEGQTNINWENVQDLLSAANMLDLESLVRECCHYLQTQMQPSNCIGIHQFADMHSCNMLRLEARKFIERHFAEVVKEDEFCQISKETLKGLLLSECLSIESEFQVFEATIRWLLHDPVTRIEYLSDLISAIRLPIISRKQMRSYIDDCSNDSLKELLRKLVDEHESEAHRLHSERDANTSLLSHMYFDVRCQPRMCARKSIYVMGGSQVPSFSLNDISSLAEAERLDIFSNLWKKLPDMPTPRNNHAAATLNGVIYVVGGENESLLLDSVYMLDPVDEKWVEVDSLSEPKTCLGLAAVGEQLFAFGGWVNNAITDSIECYDPKKDEWSYFGAMPEPRYAFQCVESEGLIYIIGGYGKHNQVLDSIIAFNPASRKFKTLASMRNARASFGAAVLHNRIYAAGGIDGKKPLRSVECYSIAENSWSTVADMKLARISPCCAFAKDELIVIGGKASHHAISLNTIERYYPVDGKWKDWIPMHTPRCEAAAVVL